MDGMTAELAFQARELSASGLWSGRIAALLDVDEVLVLRALGGDDFDDVEPAPVVESPASVPAAEPVDPDAWPPPVDGSTQWERLWVREGYGRGRYERVRWVLLWGKRVRVNDVGEVWCHGCLRFKSTAQLGHPRNSCPVGLPARGGVIWFDAEVDDEPRDRSVFGGGPVDFMGMRW